MSVMDRSRLRRLTAVAVAGALLGAAVLAVVLFSVGAIGGASASSASANTTADSTAADPSTGSAILAGPLNAPALYANANPSIVDITAVDSSTSGDTGTGFLIDSHGHVLTADHVVYGAKSVTVKFQDGVTVAARVVGHDRSDDVALLKVDPSPPNSPALTLGSTSSLVVGDSLAIIGNPFGYNRSLSIGVVSALDRTIQAPNGWLIPDALQTDAIINPGNSGGPVLDKQGAVVGIVDQIATGGSGIDSATGVGFAVPIELVKTQLSRLERGATVVHAYLGVAFGQSITSQPGALILGVASGSPAAAAGLRAGELITAVNGTAVHGPSALVAAIAEHNPGQRLTLAVRRASSPRTVTVKLANQPLTPPTTG
jgi:putative serine protease PepD